MRRQREAGNRRVQTADRKEAASSALIRYDRAATACRTCSCRPCRWKSSLTKVRADSRTLPPWLPARAGRREARRAGARIGGGAAYPTERYVRWGSEGRGFKSGRADLHASRTCSGTHSGTHSRPQPARVAWRRLRQASVLHRGIGAYSTQPLVFGLLPKLDVTGSSTVARSRKALRNTSLCQRRRALPAGTVSRVPLWVPFVSGLGA